jgi:hypothetical protein
MSEQLRRVCALLTDSGDPKRGIIGDGDCCVA